MCVVQMKQYSLIEKKERESYLRQNVSLSFVSLSFQEGEIDNKKVAFRNKAKGVLTKFDCWSGFSFSFSGQQQWKDKNLLRALLMISQLALNSAFCDYLPNSFWSFVEAFVKCNWQKNLDHDAFDLETGKLGCLESVILTRCIQSLLFYSVEFYGDKNLHVGQGDVDINFKHLRQSAAPN